MEREREREREKEKNSFEKNPSENGGFDFPAHMPLCASTRSID